MYFFTFYIWQYKEFGYDLEHSKPHKRQDIPGKTSLMRTGIYSFVWLLWFTVNRIYVQQFGDGPLRYAKQWQNINVHVNKPKWNEYPSSRIGSSIMQAIPTFEAAISW